MRSGMGSDARFVIRSAMSLNLSGDGNVSSTGARPHRVLGRLFAPHFGIAQNRLAIALAFVSESVEHVEPAIVYPKEIAARKGMHLLARKIVGVTRAIGNPDAREPRKPPMVLAIFDVVVAIRHGAEIIAGVDVPQRAAIFQSADLFY
jgi:hypothetical protein